MCEWSLVNVKMKLIGILAYVIRGGQGQTATLVCYGNRLICIDYFHLFLRNVYNPVAHNGQ